MKFTLENMGPIKKAEVELGDLTIIAGKNNTGKTYIAHTLYGFLYWLHKAFPVKTDRVELDLAYRRIVRDIKDRHGREIELKMTSDSEKSKFTVSEENGRRFYTKMIDEIGKLFSDEDISDIFSSSKEQFKDARFTCKLPSIEDKEYTSFSKHIAEFTAPTKRKPFFTMSFLDTDLLPKFRGSIVKREILYYFIAEQCRVQPFILPAERPGVPLFYKELDATKSNMVGDLQMLAYDKKNQKKDPEWLVRQVEDVMNKSARYAQPIKHHINYVRNLDIVQKGKSDFTDSKFLKDIENMIGGYYRYVNDEIRFISKKRNLFNIPLYLASSAGQELAFFYFYLKHLAKKGQMLIIDEPESHLDTTNQILLARLLARCVNAGIKVFVTTHSDYLVKEFNNLIMLSHEFEGKGELIKKFKYGAEDYIKAESIKAYVCEEGGVAPCTIYHRGIKMPVFDDTIVSINKVARTLVLHMPEDK